jgi:hypothetical protein
MVLFNLVETPIEVLVRRGGLMRMQAEDTGLRLDSLDERAAMLVKETYFAGTQYFEDPRWATFESIQAQIRAYEDARLDGRDGGIMWGVLIVALNALGGVWLARHRYQGTALLMMRWLLIPALSLIMNPLAWQRYYIIIHAPVAVLAGLGLRQIATSLQTLFEKPLSPVLPPQTEEGVRR